MFGNRHLTVALLVAPLLAVLAWFGVGLWVGERPQSAVPGESYPLLEGSRCRYGSGECTLHNAQMKLRLTPQRVGSALLLTLDSAAQLQGAMLGLREEEGAPSTPVAMQKVGATGRTWSVELESFPPANAALLVVVEASGSRWFGEAATTFLEPLRRQH